MSKTTNTKTEITLVRMTTKTTTITTITMTKAVLLLGGIVEVVERF